GYRVEEWIGRPFAELFSPRAGGETGAIREYDLTARSGATVTVEVSSHPRYVDGAAAGTIGMARDVTEQRTIARKLEEAKRMSSLGQVAASLAHEFNNVLMGIQPFVEVIARNITPTQRISDALAHITRAISRGRHAAVDVAVSAAGELVRISVRDDGPGISPQILDRIFDPLFTTKRNGTGLGLAIARRLMEGQGGALSAGNRAEGGSAFHLLVP